MSTGFTFENPFEFNAEGRKLDAQAPSHLLTATLCSHVRDIPDALSNSSKNMIIWKYIILINSRTKSNNSWLHTILYSDYYLLWCEFLMESFHTNFCNFFLQMPENVIQVAKIRMKAAKWRKLLLLLGKHLLPSYFWNRRFNYLNDQCI